MRADYIRMSQRHEIVPGMDGITRGTWLNSRRFHPGHGEYLTLAHFISTPGPGLPVLFRKVSTVNYTCHQYVPADDVYRSHAGEAGSRSPGQGPGISFFWKRGQNTVIIHLVVLEDLTIVALKAPPEQRYHLAWQEAYCLPWRCIYIRDE